MGYKIRELREARGLTQGALSESAGVSRTILSGLESGRMPVTKTSTLVKIAKALGVSIEDLFFTAV